MTPLASIRNEVLEQAITGQAVNREQDRKLVNDTPEIDSLAEILVQLGRTTTGTQRRLAIAGLQLVKQICDLNDTEHACERQIAGRAEQLTPDLIAARRRHTIKRLAPLLRPILADLLNPIIVDKRKRERLAELAVIILDAPEENLRSPSLRNELGVNKFTLLQRLLDDSKKARA